MVGEVGLVSEDRLVVEARVVVAGFGARIGLGPVLTTALTGLGFGVITGAGALFSISMVGIFKTSARRINVRCVNL